MKIKFKLSKEALLFDSPLYIAKAFLGVMLAYGLLGKTEFVGRDMISVLFGMMLTLEPSSVAGIKSGVGQIKGTLLGGVIGLIVVSIGGVNFITVPLAVALTLYVALVMDWSVVPAVAIFTSIYMTQYIQYDLEGMPNMFLTFLLRMSALGSGICIAVLVNAIFSRFGYKRMITKRLVYTFEQMSRLVENYHKKDSEIVDDQIIKILSQLGTFKQDLKATTIHGDEKLKIRYHQLVHYMILLCYEIRNQSALALRSLEKQNDAVIDVQKQTSQIIAEISILMHGEYFEGQSTSWDERLMTFSNLEVINILRQIVDEILAIKALERSTK